MTYSAAQYQEEKENGTRLPNGAMPLQKLSPLHIEIVKAHLDGVRNSDIVQIFNLTASTVSRILSDPLVTEIKKQHAAAVDAEFDALYDKAVAAIRTGLDAADPDTQLKAAGMFFKHAPSKGEGSGGGSGQSAEDVARALINMQVNVNVGGSNEGTHSVTLDVVPDNSVRELNSVAGGPGIPGEAGDGDYAEECA